MRQEITSDMAAQYNVPAGIYVDQVIPGSGADNAGMKSQDIIDKADGKDCLTMADLTTILNTHKAGDTMTLEVKRKNGSNWDTVNLTVTLGEDKPSNS